MPDIKQFRLPDAGEGLTEAEIVLWRVAPGDTVAVNDPIVEIETAKSLVELPSPYAGVVTEILVPAGTTVDVGTPIIAVDIAPAPDALAQRDAVPTTLAQTDAVPDLARSAAAPVEPERTAVLVGYGPRTSPGRRRRLSVAQPPRDHAPVEPPTPPAQGLALAKPPVRKMARDLGIDLNEISPTGPGGIVTREDVERTASARAGGAAERETRIPVRGVRKLTADAMVASAFTAPHVSEWVSVDVTRTIRLVKQLRADPAFADVKVTPLVLVARALLIAVRRNPGINASWRAADSAGHPEIVVKNYVNLGIAAATPRGLVVPNVKDADRLDLHGLAAALTDLAATARQGRTQPADMAGGTITITNVGVFGVDGGTPIINPGEAAILALGQVRRLPWVHKGSVRPRWVTQLTVSFDHRMVDGDLGSRFLADVAAVLERPELALIWG